MKPKFEVFQEEHPDPQEGLQCDQPPAGWRCTREAGHEGPCAAVPIQWYWRLVGGNGETQSISEAYTRKEDAKRGALDAVKSIFEVAGLRFSAQEDNEILEAIEVVE